MTVDMQTGATKINMDVFTAVEDMVDITNQVTEMDVSISKIDDRDNN